MTVKKNESFSNAVCKKIGNYVYRLIDPTNEETFYVGKGTGNRVFDHVKEPSKVQQDKDAVYDVEAAVIDSFPELSNKIAGHGSSNFGPMNTEQIIKLYDLPELPQYIEHKLILINVNQSVEDPAKESLYEQVRYAWRISTDRAEKADYVLAVVRGVVEDVFVAESWIPATANNFPKFPPIDKGPDRYGFVGTKANSIIWDRYVGKHGKRVVHKDMRHFQNPIRYWKC